MIIINSGLGNFNSVLNMIRKCGSNALLTNSYEDVLNSKKIILPGIGSFDQAIKSLRKFSLDKAICEALNNGSYLLAICVGMQMLFDSSEEGNLKGLSLIKGKIKKFKFNTNTNTNKLPIPHMGWNNIDLKKKSRLFSDQTEKNRVYFAHSYYAVCQNTEDELSSTNYSFEFTSSVEKNNIFGVQFHPEKSHKFGVKLFKNFISL